MKPLSESQKAFAWSRLARGPGRYIARPLFDAVVEAQLFLARLAEPGPIKADVSDITALVKSFERPRSTARLIDSIRRLHPSLKILVVDDSRHPFHHPDATIIHLPFDSGIGVGRQTGLDAINTPYFLNLDDDLVFYAGTRLDETAQLLRETPALDLIAGPMIDLPLWINADFRDQPLFPTIAQPKVPIATRFGAAEVMDKTSNFFLARTDAVRQVGWDPAIRRLDHGDFFTRARGKLASAMSDRFCVLHRRDPFDDHYRSYRFDLDADLRLLERRYYGRKKG